MAVGPVGQFDYSATVTRTDSGFSGIALPSGLDRLHPGIVGQRPTIELREGDIILQRRWPDRLAAPVRYKDGFGTPLSRVSLSVGELLHRITRDGDVLRLVRGGAGDVGLTLTRRGGLIAGLGAVEGMLPGISTDRVATLDERLAHVRTLPNPRLPDPYVRFTFDDGFVDVAEGEGAFAQPWHLFVSRVYDPGIPGALSMVGVVREHPEVDPEAVEDATVSVSCGLFDFVT
jgi:hypothetical protein